MRSKADLLSTAQWWGGRRPRYNLFLVLAGLTAFFIYATLVWSFQDYFPDAEITAFTIAFQAVGFLMALGLANICYFLGPIIERWLDPTNLGAYRKSAYGMGLAFSLALIFSPPALMIYTIVADA